MAPNFGDEVQFGGGECHRARYMIHFYCLVVETLLLPCGRSCFLQRHGRVFACRSSDPGSIPGWDRLKYFRSMTCYYTYIKADIVHVSHQINYPTSALPNKACWVIFVMFLSSADIFETILFFAKILFWK